MNDRTILVVDDDPTIRMLLAQFLEDEGFQVQTAADGQEAVEVLAVNRPHVMLLDMLMPRMDGNAVLAHIRQSGIDLPVLIFSAQRPSPELLEALDSDLRDFVAKPFELEELLVRLHRLVQRLPDSDAQLRINVLGPLQVFRGNRLLFDESWRNKPAKTIFKLLVAQPGRRFPKDVLVEELWPEADPDAAANRLRVAVHDLRKALEDEKEHPAIAQQEGAYYFNPEIPYWIDVAAFEDAVHSGQALHRAGDLAGALAAYERAESLYRADYLSDDPFLEWTLRHRETWRELRLSMLAATAEIQAALGRPEEAATSCRAILHAEPWREEVYQSLMQYLAAAGRYSDALRAYDDCTRVLERELGATPSRQMTQLRSDIARHLQSPENSAS